MGRYMKDILVGYRKIIVWGTGNFYTMYKALLDERVTYFVDNNEKKWGMSLDQKCIWSPEKLREEDTDGTLVIVCNHYFEEISVQIKQYGDFDILDIVTLGLVQEKERCLSAADEIDADRSIIVCGGIHAMWQTNGSRKFIDGQLGQLHESCFFTIEIVPLLYYQSGKRESPYLAVSVNGIYQGLSSAYELAEKYPKVRGMVIHSLYYSHGTMKTILDGITVETRILYYIHDYSCLCAHRFLYKNRKLCIGADGNMTCDICNENEERKRLLKFHQTVFRKYKVLMVAPSADTRERVESFYNDIEIVEMPHLIYEKSALKRCVNTPIRIAYIGTAIWHKGWEQFTRLVDRLHQKYDFYCLGDCPEDMKIQKVTYVSVGLTSADHVPTMTEALLQYNIDIAYIGSVWPETYSYTYYEAYEAGCMVLTNTQSGNVCCQVKENQNGIAFSSEDEMIAWLETGMAEKEIQRMDMCIKNVRNSMAYLKYFE